MMFLCVCIPYLAMVRRFWFVCEDAFITFRYSKNLAMGFGPRFNVAADELPVEGYSNFLWMLIAAICELLGLDVTIWMPMLSALCGLGVVWLVLHTLMMRFNFSVVATGLSGLMLALFTPFAVWTSSGLAPMPMTLAMLALMVTLLWGDDRNAWIAAGVWAVALSLIRTEGVYWAITIIGLCTGSRYLRGKAVKEPMTWAGGILLTIYVPYFAWRAMYYRSLLANTAYAKVSMGSESLSRGLQYGAYYALLMLSPLLWIPGAIAAMAGQRRLEAFPFVAMAFGVPLWAVLVSGDYMAFFRLMVAGVPFLVITIGFLWDFLWERPAFRVGAPALGLLAAMLGVLPGFNVVAAPKTTLSAVQTRLMRQDKLVKQLEAMDLKLEDREDHLFGMGESFELKHIRNELDRWQSMANNPYRWRVAAEVLRHTVEPEDRLVAGAIGALGYYSMPLYIYDQNGLVNREVARRDMSQDDAALRWPGHDAYVEKEFFLDREPSYLDHEVVFPPKTSTKIQAVGDRFEREKHDLYFPVVVPFSVKDDPKKASYLVLQKRAKSEKDAKAGWRKFRKQYGGSSKTVVARHAGPKGRRDKDKDKDNHRGGKAFRPEDEDALPGGRWRTFTNDENLTDEQRKELEMLELIGYVTGSVEAGEAKPVVARYDADQVYPGYNLLASGHGTEATLVDMEGNTLHSWSYAFDDVWPDYPVKASHESRQYWRRIHLYPNGDLLAIYEGLGIIRVDKDSKLLWSNANRAHHDVRVATNGDIYTLTRVARMVPRITTKNPILEDFLTVLNPRTGEEKVSVSILEAFEASEFDDVWKSDFEKKDIFHTNSLQLLDGKIADKAPAFAGGNILISMRNIDAVAVLDPTVPEIVWALTGDFALQHDPRILDNGNLLLLNNNDNAPSSVMELDPATNAIVWEFEGTDEEPFYTPSCGTAARLPNGNTLIVESDPGRAFEINKELDFVWEFHNPHRAGDNGQFVASLFQVIRLDPDEVPWLETK
jgi:hypothetical protein